jgi:hypothetical protein
MIAHFFDRQDSRNAHNGVVVADVDTLWTWLFEEARPAFLCELICDNGFKLLIGVSPSLGCSQYSAVDGSPPYLMALGPDDPNGEEYMEFLTGNTDTPIPLKYCMPMSQIKQIVADFLATGEKSHRFSWEEV